MRNFVKIFKRICAPRQMPSSIRRLVAPQLIIGNTFRCILPGVTSIARQLQKLVGTAFHRRPRLGGTPRPTPAGEGRAPARPLTGKAAFQAARSRRAPIENWQHFHIPSTPTAGIVVGASTATKLRQLER